MGRQAARADDWGGDAVLAGQLREGGGSKGRGELSEEQGPAAGGRLDSGGNAAVPTARSHCFTAIGEKSKSKKQVFCGG